MVNKEGLKQRCTGLCKCCLELTELKMDIMRSLAICIENNEIFAIEYQGEKYYKECKKKN